MKIANTVKTLTLLGLTTLTLAAASSQADPGYGYGYYNGNQNFNPWLNGPAYQQARQQAVLKERQVQLGLRMDSQLQRILGGMEDGRLTLREASGLLREHLAISALERGYMADGRLGPNELINLEQRLDEANRRIMFEKHDRESVGQKGRPGDMNRPGDMGRR
ncbi:MAG: hypothetical protein Q8M09_14170 [Pseudomonadota bacterium]|nr:hypothetical protein [Pseudomonadota bacterium]MDP1905370.1 hypothetical protein [Pseudomonadota bacterium]MDP2354174.1 hypothetical protein [Pseudomonadota bacterium]